MSLKDEMKVYLALWFEVEPVIFEERKSALQEPRWKQLISAYKITKGL